MIGKAQPIAAYLPSELLGAIFQNVLLENMDTSGRVQFQHLRMVCSSWRETSFSTPYLWTSVTLIPSKPMPSSYADLLRGWFSKSGDTLPLSLAVDHKFMLGHHLDDIIQLIVSLQGRWRYLALNIYHYTFWELIRISPQDHWANLSYLDIHCHMIDIQDTDFDPWGDVVEDHPLDQAPPITTLTLSTAYTPPNMIYPIAKDSVETLVWNARALHDQDYSSFVTQYHNLTRLDLRCESQDWNSDVLGTSLIHLDALRSFAFTGFISPTNFAVLHRFRTPLLSKLDLTLNEPLLDYADTKEWEEETDRYMNDEDMVDISFVKTTGLPHDTFLEPLVSSSRGHLTSVSIKGDIGLILTRSILALLPSTVLNLSIQYWPYLLADSDVPPPTQTSSDTPWLPKLEALRVFEVPCPRWPEPESSKWGSDADRSIASLAAFIESRLQGDRQISRLRSLGLTRGKDSKFFSEDDLRYMSEQGLKVTVWAIVP
jgi:F-box-like